jgi:cell division protein FtsI (penicillin-binding protein 3)
MTGRVSRARLALAVVLAALPLVAVLGRVGWLITVRGDEISRRAESQHLRRVWIPPHRGKVTDRNGEPLAYTMFNYSIMAEPSQVEDPRGTARALGRALGVSPVRIERQLRSPRREVYIQRTITPMMERRVDLGSLPGIHEKLELKRVYPLGESAAHVIGFLDFDEKGRAGIEGEFDDFLRGQPGWTTELRDAHGNSYFALGQRSKPAKEGNEVVLTLDAVLQDVAASELQAAAESLDAKGGTLVAVDPKTGDVLAMVSWPFYDPERVREADPSNLKNRVVTDPYEPGSTFKIVAASTALADGLLKPGTPIHCENGRYSFGSYVITDHHPYGTLPFKSCFAVSSNIAFAKVGNLCGDRLYKTARALGFGTPTGIGLAGESGGLLRPPSQWSKRSAGTVAIGYEVTATPLQLAMAYATAANGGVLMRPQLVKRIVDPSGHVLFESHPQAVRRVFSPEVAATLRSFMREVMVNGTGKDSNLEWIETGGKTGTTEKLVDGHYTGTRHYASFVGLAPIDDPKIVCAIMLDEPKGATFGGSAAAPVFKEMLEAFGRLPGSWLKPQYAQLAVDVPSRREAMGFGPGVSQAEGHDGNGGTLSPEEGFPDLRGEPLRRALQVLGAYGLTPRVDGSGVVQDQDPPPGTALDAIEGQVVLACELTTSKNTVLANATTGSKEGRPATGKHGTRPGWH